MILAIPPSCLLCDALLDKPQTLFTFHYLLFMLFTMTLMTLNSLFKKTVITYCLSVSFFHCKLLGKQKVGVALSVQLLLYRYCECLVKTFLEHVFIQPCKL